MMYEQLVTFVETYNKLKPEFEHINIIIEDFDSTNMGGGYSFTDIEVKHRDRQFKLRIEDKKDNCLDKLCVSAITYIIYNGINDVAISPQM